MTERIDLTGADAPAAPSRRAFSFQWHITDACNLKCSHCYRDGDGERELPFDEAKHRIVDQILETAPKMKAHPFIALSGGEPLLYPHLFELLDYLKERSSDGHDFFVLLMTNGVLLDQPMVDRLASYYPLLSDVQVSLDGASAAVHDAIRGRGSFERSVAGLKRVIDTTPLATTVSFTFHRGNATDVPGLLDLGQELGVSCLYVTRLVPIGRGAGLDHLLMNTDEIRAVLETLRQRGRQWEQERAQGHPRPVVAQDQTLFHLTDPEEAIRRKNDGSGGLGNACAVGAATLTILADGTVLPCRRLPIPIGNLRDQSLLEIWFGSDLLWEFRQRERHLEGKCRNCEFLNQHPGLCAGGAACIAYGTCGDYNSPDPHCWHCPAGGADPG